MLILVLLIAILIGMFLQKERIDEKKERQKSIGVDPVKQIEALIDRKLDKIEDNHTKQQVKIVLDSSTVGTPVPVGQPANAQPTHSQPTTHQPNLVEPVKESSENEEEAQDNESRFYMLTQIDKSYETYKEPKYETKTTMSNASDCTCAEACLNALPYCSTLPFSNST